jgi:CBS domain-containing protein
MMTVEESTSVQKAAEKMMDKNISSLVVIDENSRLTGLVTERDSVRRVCIQDASPSEIITKELMSSLLITIESTSLPSEAIDVMLQNNVRHLLVLDSNKTSNDKNKPIGIITPLDLIRSQDYAGSDKNDTIEMLLEYYI